VSLYSGWSTCGEQTWEQGASIDARDIADARDVAADPASLATLLATTEDGS